MAASHRKYFRRSFAYLALSACIIYLPSCKKSSETGLSALGDMSDMLIIEPRPSDPATEQKILASMGLWKKSEYKNWDSRKINGNEFVYENVVLAPYGSNIEATIKKLTLTGLHYEKSAPQIDMVALEGLSQSLDGKEYQADSLFIKSAQIDPFGYWSDFFNEYNSPFYGKNVSVTQGSTKTHIDFIALDYPRDADTAEYIRFSLNNAKLSVTDEDHPYQATLASLQLKADELGAKNNSSFLSAKAKGDMALRGINVTTDYVDASLPSLDYKLRSKKGVLSLTSHMAGLEADLSKLKSSDNADAKEVYSYLKKIGYDTLNITTKSLIEIDANKGQIGLENAQVKLKDGFDLNYDFKISGAKELMNNPDLSDAEMKELEGNLTFDNFSLTLEDKTLQRKAFWLASEITGEPIEKLKSQAGGYISAGILGVSFLPGGESLALMGEAAAEFVDKGGKLSIKMEPPQPLTFSSIEEMSQGGNFDISVLGLSATHK